MSAVPSHPAPNAIPAPGGSPIPMQTDGQPTADGRRGPRRELSQSKRAAQNRAAQRAFRQRKEGYIKKLEQQVQDYINIEQQSKLLQSENYSLREYIIHLQSKLLDVKAELPPPPANLNIGTPTSGQSAAAAASALANAAAAAAAAAAMASQPQQHQQQQQLQQQLQAQQQAQLQAQQQAQQQTQHTLPQDQKAPEENGGADPLARVAQAVAQLGSPSGSESPYGNNVKPEDTRDVKTSDDSMSAAEDIERQLHGPQETYAPVVASG